MSASVAAICDALNLPLHETQARALSDYLALLLRWNATYNLTAVRDPANMLVQHLADCLAIVPALRRHLLAAPARVLDVGSGGGLPGVVIAIMMPELDVHCVDAVGKKAAFVRQAAGTLHLSNLHTWHQRVEQLRERMFDVITARAFASLLDFTHLTRELLSPGGVWMAMKGHRPDVEIAALPSNIDVFHVEPIAVPGSTADRCLVWMRPKAALS